MDSSDSSDRAALRLERDIYHLCQLFKGRFNAVVAKELIESIGSLQEAADFIMTGDKDEVQRRFNESEEYVRSLREDSEKFIQVLSRELIDSQYACADCNKMWWKRVPAHKPCSKCMRCRRKFDPIPEENQWGFGEFQCEDCGKSFKGFGIMSRTKSTCYKCRKPANMTMVYPPKKKNEHVRPQKDTHSCNGINCYRSHVYDQCRAVFDSEKPPVCIHPHSRKPGERTKIHYASILHISTGSTIGTFLDQGSLQTRSTSPALSLVTINEESD